MIPIMLSLDILPELSLLLVPEGVVPEGVVMAALAVAPVATTPAKPERAWNALEKEAKPAGLLMDAVEDAVLS